MEIFWYGLFAGMVVGGIISHIVTDLLATARADNRCHRCDGWRR